jgi:hypothetical protein
VVGETLELASAFGSVIRPILHLNVLVPCPNFATMRKAGQVAKMEPALRFVIQAYLP